MTDMLVMRLTRNQPVGSDSEAQTVLERFHAAVQEHLPLGEIGWVYRGESDYVWVFDAKRAIATARNEMPNGMLVGWNLSSHGGGSGGIAFNYSVAVNPKTVNTVTFVRGSGQSIEVLAEVSAKLMNAIDADQVALWIKASGTRLLSSPPEHSNAKVLVVDGRSFEVREPT